jgi:hypothetical protein
LNFDPRIGVSSLQRFNCPSGLSNVDFSLDPNSANRKWFGFLGDGSTPIAATFERFMDTSNSFINPNTLTTIHRLDVNRNVWRSTPIAYSVGQGVPSMRVESVIHRSATDEYLVTAGRKETVDMNSGFSQPTGARTVLLPLRSDFSLNGSGIEPLSDLPLGFDSMRITEDNRLSLYTSLNDGRADRARSRLDVIGSIELSGASRENFGVGGLVSRGAGLRCRGLGALAVDPRNQISLATSGSGGTYCGVDGSRLLRLDATGTQLDEISYPGVANTSPGLALHRSGQRVLASISQAATSNVVRFFTETSPSVGATGEQDTFGERIILRAASAGGFVAAHLGQSEIKLLRLNESAQPIPGFGQTSVGEFAVPIRSFSALTGMEVLADGAVAVLTSNNHLPRGGEILTVHYVDPAGRISSSTVSTHQSNDTWAAGIQRNGDVIAVFGFGGTVRIVRSRRENTAALHNDIADLWQWVTGWNFARVFSIAVHPIEQSVYVSVGFQRSAESAIGDDKVLIKFDLAKATVVTPINVVAFYNISLDHYFISGGAGEIVSVDTGGAGPGWVRSGGGFKAFDLNNGIPINANPICRFYGTLGRGPNSHFYTFAGEECEAVKKDPGWTYEGIAFHIYPPVNGACSAGTTPIYRNYNNGFTRNDSNHRYSTDRAALAAMTGWTLEGVVFCSPL